MIAAVFAVTLSAQLPAGLAPAWLRNMRGTYAKVWPQGWSFFADTADTQVLTVYRISPAGEPQPAFILHMSAQNRWGLGRTAMARLEEAFSLADRIPARSWIRCDDPLSPGCLGRATAYRTANGFRPASLCGRVVFVRSSPSAAVPAPRVRSAGSVAVAELACSG